MIVHVTRRHVLSGCRHSANACPVHTAIVEAYGERLDGVLVSVSAHSVQFYRAQSYGLEFAYADLPVDVSERIQCFDAIGEMTPFSFELDDAALAQLDVRAPVSAGR